MSDQPEKSGSSKCNDNFGKLLTSAHISTSLLMAFNTGILDALSKAEGPMTSQEIADAKQLKERYVREFINALACAEVIQMDTYDDGLVKYHMPDDLKKNVQGQYHVFMRMLQSSNSRMGLMKERMQKQNPQYSIPYSETPYFVDLMVEMSNVTSVEEMNKMVAGIPGLRQRMETEPGLQAIEIGSGCGPLVKVFAKEFPKSAFVASEYDEPSLVTLQSSIKDSGLSNMSCRQLDIMDVPEELVGKFDFCFTSDVVHDLPDPMVGLKGIRKLLKDDGYFAITEPVANSNLMENKGDNHHAVLFSISAFHCVAQGYQSEDSLAHGACWGHQACREALTKNSFEVISYEKLSDNFNGLFLCKAV